MSNLIYGIFYADGYVDGGRDTQLPGHLQQRSGVSGGSSSLVHC